MTSATPRRAAVRWPTGRVRVPLETAAEPVPLVVSIGGEADGTYLWSRPTATLELLPDLDRGISPTRVALSGDGRMLFFDRRALRDDESIPYVKRSYSLGVFRLELATGEVRRSAHDPRGEYSSTREFASSPAGDQVAVAETWVVPELEAQVQGLLARRVKLMVADVGGSALRELATVPGSYYTGPDDSSVHWSPDGRSIALGSVAEDAQTGAYVIEMRVVDVASAEVVLERKGLRTVGTAGWAPDSSCLLVADMEERIKVLRVDTGELEPLPFLPGSNMGIPFEKTTRILGFLDDRTVMTVAQRGRRMLLSAVDIETGAAEPLVGCADAPEAMPVLAQMPPDYWRG